MKAKKHTCKSSVKNSIQINLIVEGFRVNNIEKIITCNGYDGTIGQVPGSFFSVSITFKDLRKWLIDEDFMQGTSLGFMQEISEEDNEDEPISWNYTFEECLDGRAHYNVNEFLSAFLNQTQKFKKLK